MLYAIGLGSNVGNKCANLQTAYNLIQDQIKPTAPLQRSAVYRSTPIDCPPGSDDFLNAVVMLEASIPPDVMLAKLLEIEHQLGRQRPAPRNAPRTIDLDILLAGDTIHQSENLCIPHPRLHLRRFVLLPLAQVAPDWVVPGIGSTTSELLAVLQDTSCAVPITDCTL